MVSLTKGQTITLAKAGRSLAHVKMGLGWDVRHDGDDVDLDASCLLFDRDDRLVDTVWFVQLKSKDGSIRHSGDNLTGEGEGDDEVIEVELDRVVPYVRTLVFIVTSWTGDSLDSVDNAFCRLTDIDTGEEVARYDLSGFGDTAQILAIVRRTGSRWADGWEMKAIGEPVTGESADEMEPVVRPFL